MATTQPTQLAKVVDSLRRAILAKDGAGLSDRQLLDLFIQRRDEAAFAALVHRHGPLVWGVCLRVLARHHDAEDAFQATFLVLARKAASIRAGVMVTSWLYGVAHRTAVKARASAGKRHMRERQVSHMPEPEALPQASWHDLEPVIDRELLRLPEKYRAAILLCDLEGKTGKDAARHLRIPESTLASRLRRARMKLARSLARQGVTLPAAALATALSQNAASASAPVAAMSSAIKGATLVAAGQSLAAGVITAKVAALTKGVMKAMLLTKLKSVVGVMVAVVVLGGVGVWVGLSSADGGAKQAESRAKTTVIQHGSKSREDQDAGSKSLLASAPMQQEISAKGKSGRVPKAAPKEIDPKTEDGDQAETNHVQELPADLIAAWKKAGARVGWMKPDNEWLVLFFCEDAEGKTGLIPAFRFPEWTAGMVAQLPQPQTAFGLDLHNTSVSDAGLKELAGLKSLRALDLHFTQVTDAGLKEMANLKRLEALSLSLPGITDVGLKELAALKSLQLLDLDDTKATDAGVKELARAEEPARVEARPNAGNGCRSDGTGRAEELARAKPSRDTAHGRRAEAVGRANEPEDAEPHRHESNGWRHERIGRAGEVGMATPRRYTGHGRWIEGGGQVEGLASADSREHAGHGHRIAGVGRAEEFTDADSRKNEGYGRGVEGVGQGEEPAIAEPRRHKDNRRGVERVGRSEGP